jgi:transcriptional regulator of acetoin/glycerol metabolism
LSLTGRSFGEIERAILEWALRSNGWNGRRAARALGISRSTFHDRAVRHRLIVRVSKRSTAAAQRKRRRG